MSDPGVRAIPAWKRFHVRTTLLFGGLALALLGAMGAASYRWARDTELAALQARLRALAIALADGIEANDVHATLASTRTSSPSYQRLTETFRKTALDETDVQSIYVIVRAERPSFTRFVADWVRNGTPASIGELYDARGMPAMLEAFRAPTVENELSVDAWGPSLSGYAPVRDGHGRAIAVVGVDVSAARLERIERRALVATGIAYGASVLVLVATGLFLGHSVRRPIDRIVEAISAIARGELGTRIGLQRDDELGVLARRFDRMAIGLQERERLRQIFGRYVSEEVARRVLASPDADRLGGEEREVTVLFVHLDGFARMTEVLPPAELATVLDRYLEAMTELVDAHGGCVIEMLGDAILAVFGAPDELAGHPAHAVRCGLAMKARVAELEGEWTQDGLAAAWKERGIERLCARIGLHTGPVVAGNTGGKTRMKYAVIGDTVNVAARIQALNARLGTTMLASGEVHARLPEELATLAVAHGEHVVKGRDCAVVAYAF